VLGVALLAQLAIVANGPDTATACLPLRVSAAIRVPGRVAPSIDLPRGSGLQLLRSRVNSRVESDGAAQYSTITEAWADVAGKMAKVQAAVQASKEPQIYKPALEALSGMLRKYIEEIEAALKQ